MTEDRASKTKGAVWLLAACFLGACLGLGLQPLARAVPWSWEKKLGAALNVAPAHLCHDHPEAQALLQRLAHRLYPLQEGDAAFGIEVTAVKDDSVNAYAVLGGRIYLHSGLLEQAESAEEVAGVLAHEITHVEHRHIIARSLAHLLTVQGLQAIFGDDAAGSWADSFLSMDFSRAQEREADAGGLTRLRAAHVDPRGLQDFFRRMKDSDALPPFLSDHPADSDRLALIEPAAKGETTPVMTRAEWQALQGICR